MHYDFGVNSNRRCRAIFVNHKSISKRGNKANEDYAFSCERHIFVIDGSSGLCDKKYTNFESDAQWFSHRLGTLLQARLHDINKTIGEVVSDIISELRVEYKSFLSDAEYESFILPSACLSVLRINKNNIELFQIGDCVSLISTINDEIKVFLDDSVPKLDGAVVKNVVNISREKKIPYSDALVYSKEQLIHNRKKLNKSDGYWILDLSGSAIKHAYVNSFKVCDVRAAAIMSDGFAEIVELYGLYDYKTLMEKMAGGGLYSLCEELFKAQDEDSTMDKYPRLKLRDDSSAAWCSVPI